MQALKASARLQHEQQAPHILVLILVEAILQQGGLSGQLTGAVRLMREMKGREQGCNMRAGTSCPCTHLAKTRPTGSAKG